MILEAYRHLIHCAFASCRVPSSLLALAAPAVDRQHHLLSPLPFALALHLPSALLPEAALLGSQAAQEAQSLLLQGF